MRLDADEDEVQRTDDAPRQVPAVQSPQEASESRAGEEREHTQSGEEQTAEA